ncbi:unnamed protein product [Periconia digitata]|uniref:Uncharacterized protein n=1 Tax=Periconia digitata TaxID=1303443 RepID=A0A9W4U1C3_9PLEO|nr:unnamed protein product [Periconia digitata]
MIKSTIMRCMIFIAFFFIFPAISSPIPKTTTLANPALSIPRAPEIFVRDNYDGQWVPDVGVPGANPPATVQPPPPPPASTQPGGLPANDIRNTSKMWILYVVIGAVVGLLFIGMLVMFARALLRWRKTGERPSLLNFGCLPQRDPCSKHQQWCDGRQA